MKYLIIIYLLLLIGCGEEKIPPFTTLPEQQIAALTAGDRTCYAIAESINSVFPNSPTHCTAIREKDGGMFKENYSFHIKTSTKQVAEWHKWGCLAAGKVMADGAKVGMEKIYFKSKSSEKYSSMNDAHVCRNLQQKAYAREITEFDVLKEFNRRSTLKEI
ncbi:hypothetical protein [Acidovorax sp. Q11]